MTMSPLHGTPHDPQRPTPTTAQIALMQTTSSCFSLALATPQRDARECSAVHPLAAQPCSTAPSSRHGGTCPTPPPLSTPQDLSPPTPFSLAPTHSRHKLNTLLPLSLGLPVPHGTLLHTSRATPRANTPPFGSNVRHCQLTCSMQRALCQGAQIHASIRIMPKKGSPGLRLCSMPPVPSAQLLRLHQPPPTPRSLRRAPWELFRAAFLLQPLRLFSSARR
mmetsp:Transcript_72933/g.193824  ORF Transcript_72933/g.193824 Transcript_72933/m.193824 type:complete len:221 (-) Transcript_72933:1265-1927(-)